MTRKHRTRPGSQKTPRQNRRNWRARLLSALVAEAPLDELLRLVAVSLAPAGRATVFYAPQAGAAWRPLHDERVGLAPDVVARAVDLLDERGERDPGLVQALESDLADTARVPVMAVPLPHAEGLILFLPEDEATDELSGRLRRRARLAGWLCQRHHMQRAQRTTRRLLDAVSTHAGAGIAHYDANAVILEVNDAYASMLGYRPEDLRGRSYLDLLADAGDVDDARANLSRLVQGGCDALESRRWLRHAEEGRNVLVRFNTHLLSDDQGDPEAIVDVVTDITENQALNEALAYERSHDPLSGLLNRAAFEERISACLGDAGQRERYVLAVVDMDRFRLINASYGTATGDLGLARVAERLRAALRPDEEAGRLGNDEFGLLLDAGETDTVLARAQRLVRLVEGTPLGGPGGESARITASIGVTRLGGTEPTQVLRQAEQAARRARDAGGNQVRLYHPDEPAYSEADRTLEWAARVQTALDDGRLALVRQPIHALAHGALPACEYLVRLVADDGRLVSPGEFLPAAEHYAMAREIDRWVIDRALAGLGAEPGKLAELEFASVNISAQSLDDPDLVVFVLSALSRHGVPANKLCLELTETAAVADVDAARGPIRILRAAGCRFALDDFGTGMASFGYLRELDVDMIKIDGRFVRNIAANRVDRGMVEAMQEIARLTEKRTIAEFVEGEEALECLRHIGVDYAQGYALGRPEQLAR